MLEREKKGYKEWKYYAVFYKHIKQRQNAYMMEKEAYLEEGKGRSFCI